MRDAPKQDIEPLVGCVLSPTVVLLLLLVASLLPDHIVMFCYGATGVLSSTCNMVAAGRCWCLSVMNSSIMFHLAQASSLDVMTCSSDTWWAQLTAQHGTRGHRGKSKRILNIYTSTHHDLWEISGAARCCQVAGVLPGCCPAEQAQRGAEARADLPNGGG